jgi:predicted patatin/cPLA2 family phospholipase
MYRLLLSITLLCSISYHAIACNILSLSGGGSFGAVEVGMMDSLVSNQHIPNHFEVITGISAGALNAAFLYHFDNITSALPSLQQLYDTTKTKDIYESDIFGLFSRWSIYNNAPLENMLQRVLHQLNETQHPSITLVGASNILTEELDVFSMEELSRTDRVNVLMSSTAIPFIFPPRSFQNGLYIDGGVISNEIMIQAIGELDCPYYNITFISARPKERRSSNITGFFSYVSRVIGMIMDTFDNQLSQVSTCHFPKGEIHACYPTSSELSQYSMLDFDYGSILYSLGKQGQECMVYPLC